MISCSNRSIESATVVQSSVPPILHLPVQTVKQVSSMRCCKKKKTSTAYCKPSFLCCSTKCWHMASEVKTIRADTLPLFTFDFVFVFRNTDSACEPGYDTATLRFASFHLLVVWTTDLDQLSVVHSCNRPLDLGRGTQLRWIFHCNQAKGHLLHGNQRHERRAVSRFHRKDTGCDRTQA